jgi:hypothetical protein
VLRIELANYAMWLSHYTAYNTTLLVVNGAVNRALRELSVGLCRGNFFASRASVGMLARCSGASFKAGMRVPTDECVE